MTKSSGTILDGESRPKAGGAGTDGIWVPSYYRRRHPFLWVRAAGGPQRVDWIAGAVLAALVFLLVSLERGPQHHVAPSAAVAAAAMTAAQDGEINADRVAYVPKPSAVDK
jgi:hypothetical protein